MFYRKLLCLAIAAALMMCVCERTESAFAGSEVFIPSVGVGGGAEGSYWYTTVWVYNPGDTTANITFSFLKRNQSNPAPLLYSDTIPPGEVRQYPNAIFTLFGEQGFGALRVVGDQRVVVSSRIFSVPAGSDEEASTGQLFSALPAAFAIGYAEKTALLGVHQTTPLDSSLCRYNYGFVETAGEVARLRITAFDEDGSVVGSDELQLQPFEPRQYNLSQRLVPAPDLENARIEVEVISATGKVLVFGSMIANVSNDPTTFEMQFKDDLLGGNGGISGVTAGLGLTGGGSSGEVALHAGAGDGITVDEDTIGLADAGVSSTKLADASVTSTKLADGSVLSAKLADGSVLSTKLANAGVTSTKLADASVTSTKLANASVTSAKLADGAALAELADDDGTGSGLDADMIDGVEGYKLVRDPYRSGRGIYAECLRLEDGAHISFQPPFTLWPVVTVTPQHTGIIGNVTGWSGEGFTLHLTNPDGTPFTGTTYVHIIAVGVLVE